MRLAEGSTSWLLAPSIAAIICFIIYQFSDVVIQSIFLFLMVLMVLLFFFFLMFFRDPNRNIGHGIVAVADGRIRLIQMEQDTDVGKCFFISTFMNVYNVHVNRSPVDGLVKKIIHHKGSHLPAFTKESKRNERVIILLETSWGVLKIVQIAGTLARRIVPYVKEGVVLKKGDKLGLIRLGSRVDVYLPDHMVNKITIRPKQMVKAGENNIATIHD